MTFDEFLNKKKIESQKLKIINPSLYEYLLNEYNILGQAAFEQRKKFIINELRIWVNSTEPIYPPSDTSS
ncbi:MAG: hypothetical protein RML72_09170 [Bacteroidia bacterium]|nr:hypothetical protein [Bacteroidia bacterium]MDW8159027.1 hypothetical protein [Bacteroidia bacterium]